MGPWILEPRELNVGGSAQTVWTRLSLWFAELELVVVVDVEVENSCADSPKEVWLTVTIQTVIAANYDNSKYPLRSTITRLWTTRGKLRLRLVNEMPPMLARPASARL